METKEKQLSAKEIAEGMTQGEWGYTMIGVYDNHSGLVSRSTDHDGLHYFKERKENLKNNIAITTAVNGTYVKGLDPDKVEEAINLFSELLKVHNDPTYGDEVSRLAVAEKAEQALESIRIK